MWALIFRILKDIFLAIPMMISFIKIIITFLSIFKKRQNMTEQKEVVVTENTGPTIPVKNDIHAIVAFFQLIFIMAIAIWREAKKDGFQWTDLFAFLSSEDFKLKIGPVVTEMPEMTTEFKNFSVSNGFDIARLSVDLGQQIYDEVKK